MNPLNLAARLIATVAQEAPEVHQELSCTQASTERAWSQTVEAPASAFGFRRPS